MKKRTWIIVLLAALAALSGCGQETILGIDGTSDETASVNDLEEGEGGWGGGSDNVPPPRDLDREKLPERVSLP
jgi:hypothetical protein